MNGPGIVAVGIVCLLSPSIGAWDSCRICAVGAQVVDFVEMILEELTGLNSSDQSDLPYPRRDRSGKTVCFSPR